MSASVSVRPTTGVRDNQCGCTVPLFHKSRSHSHVKVRSPLRSDCKLPRTTRALQIALANAAMDRASFVVRFIEPYVLPTRSRPRPHFV